MVEGPSLDAVVAAVGVHVGRSFYRDEMRPAELNKAAHALVSLMPLEYAGKERTYIHHFTEAFRKSIYSTVADICLPRLHEEQGQRLMMGFWFKSMFAKMVPQEEGARPFGPNKFTYFRHREGEGMLVLAPVDNDAADLKGTNEPYGV